MLSIAGRRLVVPMCVFVFVALAADAGASGFIISKMGGDLAGPTEPNPAAVFWNPAAIGPAMGFQAMVDLNFTWRRMDFERSWADESMKGDRPDSPGTMSTFATIPMVSITAAPGLEWLRLGLGFYVPFGHSSRWPEYDLERQMELEPSDREPIPPQAYQSLDGDLATYFVTPAVAFCPFHGLGIDWFWVGLSASWVRAEISSHQLLDFSDEVNAELGVEFAPPEQFDYTGSTRFSFAGNGWTFAVGLYAQPLDGLRLGVSWTSGAKLLLPGRVSVVLPQLVAAFMVSENRVASDARMHMDIPPAVRAGVHWDITRWLVFRVNVEYVHWQVFERLKITDMHFADSNGPVEALADLDTIVLEKNYRGAVDVRAGFRFYLAPWLMLFAGGGYDTNAVPSPSTDPALYDAEKFGIAGGVWFRPVVVLEKTLGIELGKDDLFDFAVGVNWIHFLPRDVSGELLDPPLAGNYRSEVVLLNTNMVARF